MSNYVQSVLEQLPDIQLNKLKVYDSEISRLRASKILDYNFEAKVGIFQNTEFTGNAQSPFNLLQGMEVGATLSKVFPSFGGRFELDLSYRQFSAISFTGDRIYDAIFRIPVLTLRYGIPLLKNVAGILDRYPLKMAGLESKISQWTAEEENAWILANYKKLYVQWHVAGEMVVFLEEAAKNALELENLAKSQRRTGFIDDADFQKVQILKLDIENESLNAIHAYTNLREQIAILTGYSNIAPNPEEWGTLNGIIAGADFKSLRFQDTRQNLILELMDQSLGHAVYSYKNARLPEFNIIGSLSMEAYTTNNPPTKPDQVIILPAYYAGFQIKYPFGDYESKAQYLEIYKKRKELEYLSKKYVRDYIYKTESKVRSLGHYRAKLSNRSLVVEALESRYAAQWRRYGQGRESFASLVDTRNEVLKNRMDEADLKLQLVYDYFEYMVLNNKDEASLSYQGEP